MATAVNAGPAADVTSPPLRWPRRVGLVLGVLVALLGGFLRLVALLREPVNADEAVVGLMARGILHGHFVAFYWGQSYGGFEPYLTAAVFRICGISPFSLGLTPAVLDGFAAVLVFYLGRRLFSPVVGAVAGLLFWIWPETYLWQSTVEYGFRFAALDCGLCALVIFTRLVDRARAERDADTVVKNRRDAALLGLFLGLGWWATPEIAYFALPIGIVLVLGVARRRARLEWGEVLLGLGALVLGALPWIDANLRSGGASLRSGTQPSPGFGSHLHVFASHALPLVLGLQVLGTGRWLGAAALGITLELVIGVGVVCFVVWTLLERRQSVLALAVACFPFLYAASPFTWYWRDGRYGLYLAPLLSLVLVAGASELAQRARVRERALPVLRVAGALLLLGGGSALTVLAASEVGPFRPTGIPHTARASWISLETDPNGFEARLSGTLAAKGIHRVIAGYWLAYPITFVSGGAVEASDFRYVRSSALLDAVDTGSPPAWLFVRPAAGSIARVVSEVGVSVLDPGCAAVRQRCVTAHLLEADLARWGIGYRVLSLPSQGFLVVIPDRRVPFAPLLAQLLPPKTSTAASGPVRPA